MNPATGRQTAPRPPLCVSLVPLPDSLDQQGTVVEMIRQARISGAGVAEIRLDCFQKPPDPAFFLEHACGLPLLFTNRAPWEGGSLQQTEEERLAPLCRAAQLGAAFIDLELRTDASWKKKLFAARDSCAANSSRIIFSWHDFDKTPTEATLLEIMHRMHSEGGDVGKIVTTPHDEDDLLRLLGLLAPARRMAFPLVTMAMGARGRVSRVASIFLGGFMTYACLDDAPAAAPGQMPLKTMRGILKELGMDLALPAQETTGCR